MGVAATDVSCYCKGYRPRTHYHGESFTTYTSNICHLDQSAGVKNKR
jgi:hypothetical protein